MPSCTACGAALPLESLAAAGGPLRCPGCAATLEVHAFPALFRPLESGRAGEAVLSDEESACFYHPKKRAVVPCDNCGRFLCALCDLEFNARHYCPPCLEAARDRGALPRLESQRTCHDRIAMALALYPLLIFFYPTLFTAPVALFLSVRALRSPGSLVHGSKIRCVAAMLLSTAEIVAWVLLVNVVVNALRAGK
jgi:hypothetical protein